jgi:hypothetical protein
MSDFSVISKNVHIMELVENSKACAMAENHVALRSLLNNVCICQSSASFYLLALCLFNDALIGIIMQNE